MRCFGLMINGLLSMYSNLFSVSLLKLCSPGMKIMPNWSHWVNKVNKRILLPLLGNSHNGRLHWRPTKSGIIFLWYLYLGDVSSVHIKFCKRFDLGQCIHWFFSHFCKSAAGSFIAEVWEASFFAVSLFNSEYKAFNYCVVIFDHVHRLWWNIHSLDGHLPSTGLV